MKPKARCANNDKVLYDFAHIEHCDPDGTCFEYVNDDCSYYDGPGGNLLGNWAAEWQDTHTEGVDWYNCSSAHSQSLNANRKAYAAWWLWASLSGWDSGADDDTGDTGSSDNPDRGGEEGGGGCFISILFQH